MLAGRDESNAHARYVPRMFIAIVNTSTRFTDEDSALATRAIHRQVRYHAGPAWAVHAPPVMFMGHVDPASEPADAVTLPANIPPGSYVIGLFDTDEVAGALGWHTENVDGTVFGRVNVGAILDHGGQPLRGATPNDLTVASVLSHEVLEALVDPWVNRWAEAGDGSLWAVEVGDPVEAWGYDVAIDGHVVAVSDFALPAWFDSSSSGRTHWVGTPDLPAFTLAPGGYAITKAQGADPVPVWGHEYPDWKRPTKGSTLARTSRRGVQT